MIELIEPWALVATIAVATFAIGAFIAVDQERRERRDNNWLRSERLYRRTRDIVMRDRKEASR
jgi:hypothetical protein